MPHVLVRHCAGSPRPFARLHRSVSLGLLLLLSFLFVPSPVVQAGQLQPPPIPYTAATTDLSNLGDRVFLGPVWLIHPGDNPAWASPTLDDHDWTPVDITKPAPPQLNGSPVYWYRLHATLRPGLHDLALVTSNILEPSDLFVDGTRIASLGPMSSHAHASGLIWLRYDIPEPVISVAKGQLVIAVRISSYRIPGMTFMPPLNQSTQISLQGKRAASTYVSLESAHRFTAILVTTGLYLVVSLVAIAIAITLPQQREYTAIAISLFVSAGGELLFIRLFSLARHLLVSSSPSAIPQQASPRSSLFASPWLGRELGFLWRRNSLRFL